MTDVGLTHVALTVTDMQRSLAFYAAYADLYEVHRRQDSASGADVAWITDGTRPFVVVLIQSNEVTARLSPLAHLGVGCRSRQEVIERCARATVDGISVDGPTDSGPPVGFWAFLRDPDGHTLELSYGQEIGLAVATPSNEQSK
ncbi:VOC family protein [Candidatus Accumulibacter sp. ACC003]|uniref:VOC family protein n=1 Tax=Candidatus Accumulibacter sp. ACC003 TaxID=2823334 RepID=UPI0025BAA131|nr:VOC family protein [Candidatus Accumulibacter sp. ACC003]